MRKKKGSFRTVFNAKGNRLTRINLRCLLQRHKITEENFCCVYIKNLEVLLILNFKTAIKHSLHSYRPNSHNLRMKIYENTTHSLMEVCASYLIRLNQSHSARIKKEKNFGLRLLCSILSTMFTRHCTSDFHLFILKMLRKKKKIL